MIRFLQRGARNAFLDVDSEELLGWSILYCVPIAPSGSFLHLRLVCKDDSEEGYCSQLDEDGMEDKIMYVSSVSYSAYKSYLFCMLRLLSVW